MINKRDIEDYNLNINELSKDVNSGHWEKLSLSRKKEKLHRIDFLANNLKKSGIKALSATGLLTLLFNPNQGDAQFAPLEISDLSFQDCSWTDGITANTVGAAVALVDLDNDGDLDLVLNDVYDDGTANFYPVDLRYFGRLRYFRNDGTPENPNFIEQVGAGNNPFYGIYIDSSKYDPNLFIAPQFTDIDEDGDQDLYVGSKNAGISFFENTDASINKDMPTFSASPTDTYFSFAESKLDFADLDGDGNVDVVVGFKNGVVAFVPNNGSPAPFFIEGDAQPLLSDSGVGYVYANAFASPQLADFDFDGDFDLVLGSDLSDRLRFFENTGDSENSYFEEVLDPANPLYGFIGPGINRRFPVVEGGDLDADGDIDLLVGYQSDEGQVTEGRVLCIENVSPLRLIPTMSQWGIMILSLLLSIIGVTKIKSSLNKRVGSKTTIWIVLLSAMTFAANAQKSATGKIVTSSVSISDDTSFDNFINSSEFNNLMSQNDIELLLDLSIEKGQNRRILSFEYSSDENLAKFAESISNKNKQSSLGILKMQNVMLDQLEGTEDNNSNKDFMVGYYKVDNVDSWYQSFNTEMVANFGMEVRNISKSNKFNDVVFILYAVSDQQKAKSMQSDANLKNEMASIGMKNLSYASFFASRVN